MATKTYSENDQKLLILRVRAVQCTRARHLEIGGNAQINARAGEAWRNQYMGDVPQEMAMWRDAWAMRDMLTKRISVYQWQSRWFRKRFSHLLRTWEIF